MDVYSRCPEFHTGRFWLRQTVMEDSRNLLAVYSDPKAVPLFNDDNCTAGFFMPRLEDVERYIRFWLGEYALRYYVRWSILDREAGCAVGTIELFRREASDFYNAVGLLRLDLRSDYERTDVIREITACVLRDILPLFGCEKLATKVPPCAGVRAEALAGMGFRPCAEPLYGHDGTAYFDYYIFLP